MRRATLLLLACAAHTLCSGCAFLCAPSTATKNHSYKQGAALSERDHYQLTHSTFYLLSSGTELDPNGFGLHENSFNIDPDIAGKHDRGIAFAIDARGYLLTAEHCLDEQVYLLGMVQGRVTLLRPVVVARLAGKELGAEYALLRVPGPLDCAVARNGEITPGSGVTAVLFDTAERHQMRVAGGTALSIRPLQDSPVVGLVETSLPIWRGDSGSPLLDAKGRVVGINTAAQIKFGRQKVVISRLSCLLDFDHIRGLIAEDIAIQRARATDVTTH